MNDNVAVQSIPIQQNQPSQVKPDPNDEMRMDYYLATGQVVFLSPETQTPEAQVLNTLVVTEAGAGVNARAIGRVQQALQGNMVQRMGGNPPKFVDVVILSLAHLGQFTKAEFQEGSMLAQAPQGHA